MDLLKNETFIEFQEKLQKYKDHPAFTSMSETLNQVIDSHNYITSIEYRLNLNFASEDEWDFRFNQMPSFFKTFNYINTALIKCVDDNLNLDHDTVCLYIKLINEITFKNLELTLQKYKEKLREIYGNNS
jgi:GTP-sensing pleiotropic transcriptional regulator CodY